MLRDVGQISESEMSWIAGDTIRYWRALSPSESVGNLAAICSAARLKDNTRDGFAIRKTNFPVLTPATLTLGGLKLICMA